MSIAKVNNQTYSGLLRLNNLEINGYSISANTKLLCKFEGADGATSDTAETGQTITFVGTAQLDNAQKRFGSTSLLLDGDSDYVTVPDSADWDIFGTTTESWTVDFYAYHSTLSSSSTQVYIAQYDDDNNYWSCYVDPSGNLSFYIRDTAGGHEMVLEAATAILANQWNHIAMVKIATAYKLYVNGIQVDSNTSTKIKTISSVLFIGNGAFGFNDWFNGWIDHVRITKEALWTSNFTPPIDLSKINGITI